MPLFCRQQSLAIRITIQRSYMMSRLIKLPWTNFRAHLQVMSGHEKLAIQRHIQTVGLPLLPRIAEGNSFPLYLPMSRIQEHQVEGASAEHTFNDVKNTYPIFDLLISWDNIQRSSAIIDARARGQRGGCVSPHLEDYSIIMCRELWGLGMIGIVWIKISWSTYRIAIFVAFWNCPYETEGSVCQHALLTNTQHRS